MRWDIPGLGLIDISTIVMDYSGTLALSGKLIPGLADHLQNLAKNFNIHVLTGDSYGIAAEQLDGLNCELHILTSGDQAIAKQEFIEAIDADQCIALGNGLNDALMLRAAKLGIAVLQEEGLATACLHEADILVRSMPEAMRLLKDPQRLISTLRN